MRGSTGERGAGRPVATLVLAVVSLAFAFSVGPVEVLGGLVALALVGPALEVRLDRVRVLAAWGASAVVAALLGLALGAGDALLSVTLSGATAGLVGLAGALFARSGIALFVVASRRRRAPVVPVAWVVLAAAALLVVPGLASDASGWAALVPDVLLLALGVTAGVAAPRFAPGVVPGDEAGAGPDIDASAWMPPPTPGEPPALTEARELVARGGAEEAKRALRAAWGVRDADLRLADVLWVAYLGDGRLEDAAEVLHIAVERYLSEGKILAALDRWQRVVDATGQRGTSSLRLALAEKLLPNHRDAARDFLAELAELPPPDPVGERAAQLMLPFASSESERVRWQGVAQRHRPRDGEAIARSGERRLRPTSGIGLRLVKPPPRAEPLAVAMLHATPLPGALAASAAQMGAARAHPTPMPAPTPKPAVRPAASRVPVEPALIVALRDDALTMRIALGPARHVSFARIAQVSCARVGTGAREVEIFELAVRAGDGDPTPRRLRVDMVQLRPGRLLGAPEMPPEEAWQRLVYLIAQRSGARLMPDLATWRSRGLPSYVDLPSYEGVAHT